MQPPTFKGQSILLCKVTDLGKLHNLTGNAFFKTQRNAEFYVEERKFFGLTID
jgi:hypothetical protein